MFNSDLSERLRRYARSDAELHAAVIYTFKSDERPSLGPRSFAQRGNIPGVHGWNRVENAARAAEMCVDVVSLVD